MKASELRIGNIIVHRESQYQIRTVIGIDYNFIIHKPNEIWGVDLVDEIHETSEISNIDPIPLTEEWLLKFGFSTKKYTELNGHTIQIKNGKYYLCSQYIGREYYVEIEFVHQLQNLYFDLTRDELNIYY